MRPVGMEQETKKAHQSMSLLISGRKLNYFSVMCPASARMLIAF